MPSISCRSALAAVATSMTICCTDGLKLTFYRDQYDNSYSDLTKLPSQDRLPVAVFDAFAAQSRARQISTDGLKSVPVTKSTESHSGLQKSTVDDWIKEEDDAIALGYEILELLKERALLGGVPESELAQDRQQAAARINLARQRREEIINSWKRIEDMDLKLSDSQRNGGPNGTPYQVPKSSSRFVEALDLESPLMSRSTRMNFRSRFGRGKKFIYGDRVVPMPSGLEVQFLAEDGEWKDGRVSRVSNYTRPSDRMYRIIDFRDRFGVDAWVKAANVRVSEAGLKRADPDLVSKVDIRRLRDSE